MSCFSFPGAPCSQGAAAFCRDGSAEFPRLTIVFSCGMSVIFVLRKGALKKTRAGRKRCVFRIWRAPVSSQEAAAFAATDQLNSAFNYRFLAE